MIWPDGKMRDPRNWVRLGKQGFFQPYPLARVEMFWAACVRRPDFMTTVLLLPPVVVFVATDFAARVVKLAVELRFLTSGDDAVGLRLGLVSPNLRFVPFDLCGFAARKRSVFQPAGDAALLVLLASVNARRIPAVAMDFAARVVKLAVEPRALTTCDDAVGLGLGLVSLNLRFVPFDLCGFAARKRSVFQPAGDAVLLVLLASVNARRIPAVAMDFAARVVKLAVEPRALTTCDDAVGLGLGLVSLNLRFVPFDLRGFAARNRSVFQPVGDAFLLVMLAAVNASSLCLRISD